ncbi:MAG: hypothetical protein ACXWKM_08405 [Phenylobacterium sp.]
MSSITPVSYQPTYVPVTPVRPVVYDRTPAAAPATDEPAAPQVSAAKPPGTGALLDIKV